PPPERAPPGDQVPVDARLRLGRQRRGRQQRLLEGERLHAVETGEQGTSLSLEHPRGESGPGHGDSNPYDDDLVAPTDPACTVGRAIATAGPPRPCPGRRPVPVVPSPVPTPAVGGRVPDGLTRRIAGPSSPIRIAGHPASRVSTLRVAGEPALGGAR